MKLHRFLGFVAFLLLPGLASGQAVTDWQIHPGVRIDGFEGWDKGFEFDKAPSVGDKAWKPCPNPREIGWGDWVRNSLKNKKSESTFFQCVIENPAKNGPRCIFRFDPVWVEAGIRVVIINRKFPTGQVVGEFVRDPITTPDNAECISFGLSRFLPDSGWSRLLVIHNDGGRRNANLQFAVVEFDGVSRRLNPTKTEWKVIAEQQERYSRPEIVTRIETEKKESAKKAPPVVHVAATSQAKPSQVVSPPDFLQQQYLLQRQYLLQQQYLVLQQMYYRQWLQSRMLPGLAGPSGRTTVTRYYYYYSD